MNRETTNRIRFVLEELIPPLLKDTKAYLHLARLVWGRHIDALADFRTRAPFLTDEEYEKLYREHPRVHDATDNSQACIMRIASDVLGQSICDVGCGTGHLLREIRTRRADLLGARLVGVDFVVPEAFKDEGIEFKKAKIEKLPFSNDEFDTVICTHVIEHILDYRAAVSELRRIARRRLIIVVPRERESLYTFNPHFNFYPYKHSLLRALSPLRHSFQCDYVGRDIYFVETLE